MKPISNNELKRIQLDILKNVDAFCRENNINYSLAFGTLLGAVRHGGYIPWDDDIDIMMTRENYDKFLKTFKDDRYKSLSFPETKGYLYPFSKISDTLTSVIEDNTIKYDIGVCIDLFPVDKCPSVNRLDKWFKKKDFLNIVYTIKTLTISKDRKIYKNLIIILVRLLFFPLSKSKLCGLIQKMAKQFNNQNSNLMGVLSTGDTKKRWIMLSDVFKSYKVIKFEAYQFQCINDTNTYLEATYGGNYMKLPPLEKRVTHHSIKAFWK